MADFTNEYDITTPAGTEDISQGDDRIRAFKADLEERLEAMFYGFNADSTTGDEATAGAKALNFKEQASIATPSADQITLAAKEAGGKAELHVKDEDGDEFQITTGGKIGGSNIELTTGKNLNGSSTSDININDKFTVVGATGNTVIAGSLNPASFITDGGGFIDEDSMATDSASKVCSQQSIKAYTDALFPSGLSFDNDGNVEVSLGELQIKVFDVTVTTSGNSQTITFASQSDITAFSNACAQVFLTEGQDLTNEGRIWVDNFSATTFQINFQAANISSKKIRFLAIGR